MAKILVVDDEELARFSIRDTLEKADHEVEEAENGVKALEMQGASPFDLIITDIIMPEKEGLQTLVELKQLYPSLKIIVISGGGRTRNLDFLKLAEDLGANSIISKPFSEDELMEHVNACLAG